jgi:cephalosporin hydroxylase
MKLTIDTLQKTLGVEGDDGARSWPLYSDEAFELLSDLWLKVGWNQRYSYSFTWLGRPIIQLPEDIVRMQEVIWQVKPDVIVETGVAHGGSLILYASLCQAMNRGRIVGVDLAIRPPNRAAIEGHPLASRITLIEGSSTAPDIVAQVRARLQTGDRVMVILDSCHTRDHVRQELEAYAALVTPGSYLVATDGIMKDLGDVPHGQPAWTWDNPAAAAVEFAATHPEFVLEQPAWLFNESRRGRNLTYWPQAFLRRV